MQARGRIAFCVWLLLLYLPYVDSYDKYTDDGWFYRSDEGLTEVPDDIPDEAVGIYIDTNNITELHSGDFAGLSKCTFISLSWNRISDIEPGSFVGLTTIADLTIFQNKLTQLKSGMFTGLDSLDNLVLSNNLIENIYDGAFMGLHNLKKLYLYGNNLTHLRAQMFVGLDSLDELTLSFNQITTMEEGSFQGLSNVKELWLDNNIIRELVYNQFVGLDSMKLLHMTINNISKIANGTFTGQNSLQKIWIDSNKIEEPRRRMFDGLYSIELLNMDGNFISVIRGGVFSDLVNIKKLDFENNTIVEVQPDAFRGLSKLSTVWLNENNLTTLASSVFFPLPRPLTFSLNENPFQCDPRLCWLKRGEKEGWIRWNKSREGRILKPDCANGVYWEAVTLDCPDEVDCTEPGGIAHAARSETHWPLSVGAKVTYTCNPCYTGGGNITCQRNGQWTKKPTCRVITCGDPGDVKNAAKVPAVGPYTCGKYVTYLCNHGYYLQGDASLGCQSNGTFNGSLPTCVLGSGPRIAASTSAKDDSTDQHMWVYIAVGGAVFLLLIIIVCAIVILKRRGFHICYRQPQGRRDPADHGVGAAAATGGTSITNMDPDGGFVNKAAMFDDDNDDDVDNRYTKLQARSGGDGADGPQDTFATAETYSPAATPTELPPEYTRHPSYMEVVDDPV